MKICDLSLWKKTLLGTLCLVLLHEGVSAQCTNNLSVRTYDTVITGPGYGTYHLTFPKWRADSGLLVSVKISAVVDLQYTFSLKNTDAVTGTYGLWVGREDYYSSPALSAAYDNTTEQKIGSYTLNPGEQVSQPPFAFLSNYANTDSISGNTAPFLGAGTVNFTYSPITYTNMHAINNVSYGYHATATDVTRFSISYLYCNGDGILAQDLTSFTASLAGSSSVRLNWSTAMEQMDRTYEIQRSRDGLSFSTIGYQGAGASRAGEAVSYTYLDEPEADARGLAGPAGAGGDKWYYRLRLVSTGGISYSAVQSVNILRGASDRLVVFPNPAIDHINLLLPGDPAVPGDWLVNIRTVDGRLVQSATFFHSNNLPIFFHQHLAPGIYFVQVTDQQGRDGRVASFRVDAR